MKIKIKLSIIVIAIMAIIVTGIAAVLLFRASNIAESLSVRSIGYLCDHQAEYWKGREDGHVRMLRTLADIMADYEDMEPDVRRNRFDSMLLGTITSNPGITSLYTVWKPNAVDGMDAENIGRPGSTATGQYAINYTRETGPLTIRTTSDVDASMAHINGPNARKDRVEDPIMRNIAGKEMYVFRIVVPIINSKTKEVVGGVGCLMTIDQIQPTVEQIIRDHTEIAVMAVYTNSGFILAHLVPERVGKYLIDVDTLYGDKINDVNRAISDGRAYETASYSPVLKSNVMIDISPFSIGNSDTTWSVMTAATEEYILTEVREMTLFAVIMGAIAIVAAAAIIFFVINPCSGVSNSIVGQHLRQSVQIAFVRMLVEILIGKRLRIVYTQLFQETGKYVLRCFCPE